MYLNTAKTDICAVQDKLHARLIVAHVWLGLMQLSNQLSATTNVDRLRRANSLNSDNFKSYP